MTKKKIIILVIAVLIIALIIWYFFKKPKQIITPTSTPASTDPLAPKTISGNDNFPLQIGSRGDKVKQLQTAINKKTSAGLTVDGVFGELTKSNLQGRLGYQYYPVTEEKFNFLIG